jgi:hypothetical protein
VILDRAQLPRTISAVNNEGTRMNGVVVGGEGSGGGVGEERITRYGLCISAEFIMVDGQKRRHAEMAEELGTSRG